MAGGNPVWAAVASYQGDFFFFFESHMAQVNWTFLAAERGLFLTDQ